MKGTIKVGDKVSVKKSTRSPKKEDYFVRSGVVTRVYNDDGKVTAADIRCPIDGLHRKVKTENIGEAVDLETTTPAKRERSTKNYTDFGSQESYEGSLKDISQKQSQIESESESYVKSPENHFSQISC